MQKNDISNWQQNGEPTTYNTEIPGSLLEKTINCVCFLCYTET